MRRLLLGLVVCLSLGACQAPPKLSADWTILFYLDADNDLEEPSLNDLRELLGVGSTDKVNLVMLCDRSDLDSSEDGYSNERVFNLDSWQTGQLLYIGKEHLTLIDDWGETNMADSATLTRFLREAPRLYPAKKYALILGDHGSGWEGTCSDDSAEGDMLTLAEIDESLRSTQMNLELIGFDSCFMGGFEVALTVAPYAKVMVASEELEPTSGWDYRSLLLQLERDPSLDGLTLARTMLEAYAESFEKSGHADIAAEGAGITLSAIDLGSVGEVGRALDRLGKILREGFKTEARSYWLGVAKSRRQSEEYGVDGDEAGAQTFDLKSFAQNLAKTTREPGTKAAALALEVTLDKAIIKSVSGQSRPGSQGLSIYLPATSEFLEEYSSLPIWQDISWPQAMDQFLAQSSLGSFDGLSKVEATAMVALPHEPVEVRAELKELDEVAEVYFVLAERKGRDVVLLGRRAIKCENSLEESWDGTWLTTDEHVIFPISSESLQSVGTVAGDGKTITLQVQSDEVVGATYKAKAGVRSFALATGQELDLVYPLVDEFGERRRQVREDSSLTVNEDKELPLSMGAVEAGAYEVGFLVVDYSGRWHLEFTPVRYGLEES